MMETIAKISKTKNWLFDKIKLTDHQPDLLRKIKKKTQINKIRNKKGEVITDNSEIQKIIRDYYEQLYANKMDKLEEMDKFLEKYNLLILNQEEREVIRPFISTKINTAIKNLSTNKSSG